MKTKTLKLTVDDLDLIEVAVRLRAEACEDNDEVAEAQKWRAVEHKVVAAIDKRVGRAMM